MLSNLEVRDLEGLFVEKGGRYINQISNTNYALKLLATGGGLEVMTYEVWADKPAHIVPGDKPDLMEFYFILEGVVILKIDSGDIILNKGEHFYVYNLKDNIQLSTNNGAKILFVSSQPVFGALSDYYQDLYQLLNQSEIKDIYTYNHGQRVQMYSMKICEKLTLSDEIIASLQISSLFHDIGKINIPDNILKKPDKLTKEEYDLVKKHSEDSGLIIKEKFDDRTAEIVMQHHERLDGSGYPKGLKDDEILMEAKIIAVADTYDAMTSDRAYRRGVSPECAMDELKKLSGTHYDAKVVDALYEVFKSDGIIPGA